MSIPKDVRQEKEPEPLSEVKFVVCVSPRRGSHSAVCVTPHDTLSNGGRGYMAGATGQTRSVEKRAVRAAPATLVALDK